MKPILTLTIVLIFACCCYGLDVPRCYTNVDPSDYLTEIPTAFKSCVSFVQDCSVKTTGCSATEISEKATKTKYQTVMTSECNTMNETLGYSDVFCCRTDLCNAPKDISDKLACYYNDEYTQYFVNPAEISCLSFELDCSVNYTDFCTTDDIDYNIHKTVYQISATANCDMYKANSDFRFTVCCQTNLCNHGVIFSPMPDDPMPDSDDGGKGNETLSGNGVEIKHGKKCYLSGENSQLIEFDVEDQYLCARYGFKCTENDTACTQEEISSGITKEAYIFTSKENCDAFAAAPQLYVDAYCCNTSLCNGPLQKPTENGGVASNNGDSFNCYTHDLNYTIAQTTVRNGSVCARWNYQCVFVTAACSSNDVTGKIMKQSYGVFSQQTCQDMKSYSNLYMDLLCCNTSLCNVQIELAQSSNADAPLVVAPGEAVAIAIPVQFSVEIPVGGAINMTLPDGISIQNNKRSSPDFALSDALGNNIPLNQVTVSGKTVEGKLGAKLSVGSYIIKMKVKASGTVQISTAQVKTMDPNGSTLETTKVSLPQIKTTTELSTPSTSTSEKTTIVSACSTLIAGLISYISIATFFSF